MSPARETQHDARRDPWESADHDGPAAGCCGETASGIHRSSVVRAACRPPFDPLEVSAMSIRRRLVVATAALTLVVALPGPTSAAPRGFHLTLPAWDFTSGTCLQPGPDDSCVVAAVQADGTVAGTQGTGAYHADLVVDSSPGGTCNIVDESDTFAFPQGILFVHSHHEDCRIHGNRIFTDFAVVGGTGAYAGASGSGLEFGNGGAPITFNGRFD
jgi:hypothetical protein